ncbi:MAG: ABC-F family ATP-binding cassette domain-containing protein [Eubacterium sp.]|jgi:ATPase subunit of ABC transporter with duplicated ATPase domains|nr:ABC-F family ATP-binding cassette domain-containing protein [Eubacterium sp.]
MAQINVADLTFSYEGSFDCIFEGVSFSIDTNWKLGFIGRNGKGKTTFLNILLGKYDYAGKITSSVRFDYFPYQVTDTMMESCASDWMQEIKPGCEDWLVLCELAKLNTPAELLYRPFSSLSQGERTRVLLSILFSGENEFLLMDEPTSHLDRETKRQIVKYLEEKKGFILVSHDREILDNCIDHVLVLNRKSIEVQCGNFSSWWENKCRRDHFAEMENEKHLKEISILKKAASESRHWAVQNEQVKIGRDPVKEHDRPFGSRAFIGAKTKKMNKRVKNYEKRIERELLAKEGLLSDLERPAPLRLNPLVYHSKRLVYGKDVLAGYEDGNKEVLKNISFELLQGERVFLHGANGCGKSTFLKALLLAHGIKQEDRFYIKGELKLGAGLIVSYVSQDTGYLKGGLKAFCSKQGLEEPLFFSLLRQLDMERGQFSKKMEDFSEGQKKKVLIAASLATPAHLYIWDEPLNYIDVFSRMQIEELLLKYCPTMIVVEHDVRFREKVATRILEW